MLLDELPPVTTVAGVKARLTNLGYYQGGVDDFVDSDFFRGLRAFQHDNGLPETSDDDFLDEDGELTLDAPTRSALEAMDPK